MLDVYFTDHTLFLVKNLSRELEIEVSLIVSVCFLFYTDIWYVADSTWRKALLGVFGML